MIGAARGELTTKWSNSEVNLLEAVADDINHDGVLEIIGIMGNNLVIVEGGSGKAGDLIGVPMWSPRVADLDKDGTMEIMVALESMLAISANPTKLKIYTKSWIGWKDYFEESGKESTVHAVADLDGDGRLEVVGSSMGREMRVYKGFPPNAIWRVSMGVVAQAALGDLDGDGIIDIIASQEVECASGRFVKPGGGPVGMNYPIHYSLDLVVLRGSDGQVEFTIPDLGKWTRAPITADLTMKGRDDAIIFSDYGLQVISDGKIAAKVDRQGGFYGGAVGDFNKAEGLEIVVVDGQGAVLALDSGGAKLWDAALGAKPSGQPVIADLKGDGEQEIVFPVEDGRLIALRGDSGAAAFEAPTGRSPHSLLVADVDGDEKLEILVASGTGLTLYGTNSSGEIQWPTSIGDAQGTHSYRLSRAYAARARYPQHYKVFQWKIFYIMVAVMFGLGLVGLLVYVSFRQVKEVAGPTSEMGDVAELWGKYLKNREDRIIIRKLALELAQRNVTDLKAIEVYQKNFKLVPEQTIVTKALALAYLVRNALNPESEQVFKKAVELAPNDQKLMTGLVTLYSQNKRIDPDAMQVYEKFYYQGLDNPRATSIISRELARGKNTEPLAIHLYHRQLKAEPANTDVLAIMLDYQRGLNNTEEYLSYARAAILSEALPLGMQLLIARDFLQWELFEDAEQILKKCVTDHPHDIETWQAYKALLTRAGRDGEARQAANRLVQIYTDLQRANPTLTDFKIALGNLYKEVGDPAAAASQLKTIPPQDPHYQEAAVLLTEVYIELGELDKAETFFESISGAAQRHPELFQKIEQLRKSKIFMPSGVAADGQTITYDATKTPVGRSTPQRYKLLNELGRGGMGVVYRALDTVLNRNVAFKILPEDLRDHPKIAESFVREAQALAALSHPNIVTIFDAGQQAGNLFFAMQYIEGTDLKAELKKVGKMPVPRAITIVKDLCRALAYAHEKRIVHRDIKTSNVMLTKDGGVMLMDFGLSKFLEESAAARTAVSGTPYYMSPEQTIGEGIDHRTDIYSLGVMMFELLTGRVPFPSGDIGYHHLHTLPENPTNLNPEIPQRLSDIILKCMEKDKEKRYQSASDILKDLEGLGL